MFLVNCSQASLTDHWISLSRHLCYPVSPNKVADMFFVACLQRPKLWNSIHGITKQQFFKNRFCGSKEKYSCFLMSFLLDTRFIQLSVFDTIIVSSTIITYYGQGVGTARTVSNLFMKQFLENNPFSLNVSLVCL